MCKESLFELIRKEEVILWVGAGLSSYAGFPTGKRLGEILIENLSQSEREAFDSNLLLPDLAEEFFRIKGNNKNALIKILIETFTNASPESTEYHDILATIPHFKTIVTTNFDSLLENSFDGRAQKAFIAKHVPYLEKDKTHIFKIHGDLSNPDSIIITRSDYNNFFKRDSGNDVFWNVIKERISTKNILFLGYNLEDQNVQVLFDMVSDTLGDSRKECFLVAPNIPTHKIKNLTLRGIHYINQKAEDFILELIQNIKEFVIEDLEKGKISADTFKEFLSNYDLLPDLKTGNKHFSLSAIRSRNNLIKGEMNLTFKDDQKFIQDFKEYFSGERNGTFEISDEIILNANLWIEGLKLPFSSDISKMQFKSIPTVVTNIDLRFEDHTEFNDIPITLFNSTRFFNIHVDFKNASLIVKIDKQVQQGKNFNYKMEYQHNKIINNVKEEIELFSILLNLAERKQFTVFTRKGEIFPDLKTEMPPLLRESQIYLKYFTDLNLIEHFYKIRFSSFNISELTQSAFENVSLIIKVINNESVEYFWDDEMTIELSDYSDSIINELIEISKESSPVMAEVPVEEFVEIHGFKINIGYKTITIIEPFITNIQALKDKKESILKIKSKNGKISVSYSKIKGKNAF